MKLADKITLLRKKNGYSQEELADLLDVSRQSVSKWESSQSIPDLKKILKMSSIFGVSTDYLLKDELGEEDLLGDEIVKTDNDYKVKYVSMQEASDFLGKSLKSAKEISFAVMLCILSPVMLIFLMGLMEMNMLKMSEDRVGAFGVMILIAIVAISVGIIIKNTMKMKEYDYLENDVIETEYGVDGMAKDRKREYSEIHTRSLIIGVGLCIASVIPIMCSIIVFGEESEFTIFAVCILLIMVSIGVKTIVDTSIVWGSIIKLLEEDEYTRSNKAYRRNSIMGIYWCIVIAIYLCYSFVSNNWSMSWIIWPVAGVLSAVVSQVEKMIKKKA
ncbi:MAG: helix-turn-helix transcriptional regulator [Peptostreptococcus porci]|nr:helix-turn-helix transcriptional regulator [Peptostreptococcus porci]